MIADLNPAAANAVSLRRLALVAAALAVVLFAVFTALGMVLIGLFACVGVGLGLLNTAVIKHNADKFAASGDPHQKRRSAGSVLGRLAVITLIAVGCVFLVRPEGLGVFVGLALFQFLMIFVVLIPLIKELRRTGVQT